VHVRIDRAESAAAERAPRTWSRLRMPSRRVLQPGCFAAVRARPNVGRACRSFRSFRPASDAHYGVRGLASVHVRIDRAESAAAERAPVGAPDDECHRVEYFRQRPRSGESAPQRGSQPPIRPLIRRASDAYLWFQGLPRIHAPTDRPAAACRTVAPNIPTPASDAAVRARSNVVANTRHSAL
jgi:hypothetical protein